MGRAANKHPQKNMRDLMKEPKWLQAKSIPRSENKKHQQDASVSNKETGMEKQSR